jgi:hypothetical protein
MGVNQDIGIDRINPSSFINRVANLLPGRTASA